MQFSHMDSMCVIAEEAGVTAAGCHTFRCVPVPLPTSTIVLLLFSTVKL